MSISSLHTIADVPVPLGYFDQDNIAFIANKITTVLSRQFKQRVTFDRASIVRLMQRVAEERLESIPRMNQRVVMYAVNEFSVHQLEADKHMRWQAGYYASQQLYDWLEDKSHADLHNRKLSNRLGLPRVGGTVRFYFS